MRKKLVLSLVLVNIIMISFAVFAYSNNQLLAEIVSFKVFLNGEEKTFKNSIVTINDTTYIPLREVAETLDMDVEWSDEDKTININNDNVLYPFEYEDLWGFKNFEGRTVIKPEYGYAYSFSDGLAAVTEPNGMRYGYIDMDGNMVIPYKYFDAYSFNNGIALVYLADHTDADRWGYIDKNGNLLFNKEFTLASSFSEGYAAVLKRGYGFPLGIEDEGLERAWSYIDTAGEFVTDLEFEEALDFKDGYAMVKNNGLWGIIDKQFNLVVPYEHDVESIGSIFSELTK